MIEIGVLWGIGLVLTGLVGGWLEHRENDKIHRRLVLR